MAAALGLIREQEGGGGSRSRRLRSQIAAVDRCLFSWESFRGAGSFGTAPDQFGAVAENLFSFSIRASGVLRRF